MARIEKWALSSAFRFCFVVASVLTAAACASVPLIEWALGIGPWSPYAWLF